MDIKKFLKWENLFIIFLAVILIGILISKQSYIANPNHDMKNIPVFKEISLNQYEEVLKTMTEATVQTEDIESLLEDPQFCVVEIRKSTQIKSVWFTYHGTGIAKKSGNEYQVLDSTVINQYYTTTKGIVFEPAIIECENLSDGTLRVSAHGKLLIDKKIAENGEIQLSEYSYWKEEKSYFRTISIETFV